MDKIFCATCNENIEVCECVWRKKKPNRSKISKPEETKVIEPEEVKKSK